MKEDRLLTTYQVTLRKSDLTLKFMYIEIWIVREQRYLSDNLQQKIIPVKQFIVTRSAKRAAAFSGCPLRLLHNKASIKLCTRKYKK